MNVGAFYIPKDEPPGEDAYFICAEEQTVGVADGVGAWALSGVDAGIYARELMINSVAAIQNQPNGAVNPKEVLKEAHLKTKAEGSTTALVVTLIGHHLHAANVGDSGFMVFRGGKLVFQSPVQLHEFNYPFQLGSHHECDPPSSAEELSVAVKSGDVVVVGTDGLFDNMHAHDIADVVKEGQEEGVEPQQLAEAIAQVAQKISQDSSADTPVSRTASAKFGEKLEGGKPDDITVIVAYIV
ncbi:hypothetical protein L1049_022811 [Liquidambar formosana]|uniref:Protein phosphatase n=1 Tax=Liquidambar formosana TaxID=63359 RepID=A0AAP0WPF8_LIQFO